MPDQKVAVLFEPMPEEVVFSVVVVVVVVVVDVVDVVDVVIALLHCLTGSQRQPAFKRRILSIGHRPTRKSAAG